MVLLVPGNTGGVQAEYLDGGGSSYLSGDIGCFALADQGVFREIRQLERSGRVPRGRQEPCLKGRFSDLHESEESWCALGDDLRTWMRHTVSCDWVQLQS